MRSNFAWPDISGAESLHLIARISYKEPAPCRAGQKIWVQGFMKSQLHTVFFACLLALSTSISALAEAGRTSPVFDTWTTDCINTGVCYASSLNRNQSAWVEVRIVRDWQADAPPLVRLTTNIALPATGDLRIDVDGQTIETLPIEQLREIQPTVTPPAGFSPVGGEGFWYPTGASTRTLLQALQDGWQLTVHLPTADEAAQEVVVTVPLKGITSALRWLDDRQERTGTVAAFVDPGTEPATDAPHALPVLGPEELPPQVSAIWNANRLCSAIDPAIFTGLSAVRIPLGSDGRALYLIPCGAPTAFNSAYVTILARGDGSARPIHFARMSENGPLATDLIYNAQWVPADQQLISYFKGSAVGECGLWNRWHWNGTALVLLEEAVRKTCDGQRPDLSSWSTTWPKKNASK